MSYELEREMERMAGWSARDEIGGRVQLSRPGLAIKVVGGYPYLTHLKLHVMSPWG